MYEQTFPVWTRLSSEHACTHNQDAKFVSIPLTTNVWRGIGARSIAADDCELLVPTKTAAEECVAALCHSKDIENIEWERLHTAAVYTLPRKLLPSDDCLTGAEAETYDTLVFVIPLSWIVTSATYANIQPCWKRIVLNTLVDLRWFMTNGRHFRSDRDHKNAKDLWKEFFAACDLDSASHLSDAMFILNGERLDDDNVCSKCPNFVQRSLGRCELLALHCTGCTEARPELKTYSAPLYERLFPSSRYRPPERCITTPAFESTRIANNLVVDFDNSDLVIERYVNAQDAAKTRRLRNTLCKTCVLNNETGGACPYNPRTCDGPILLSEIEKRDCDEDTEPWQYDVLMQSGSTIPIANAKKYLSLKHNRAPLVMVGPYNTGGVRSQWWGGVYSATSCQAKDNTKKVVTLRKYVQADDGSRYRVTYREFCKILGKKEVHTWTQLYKQYPQLKKRTACVRIAVDKFIRNRSSHADVWRLTPNEFTVGVKASFKRYGGDYEDHANALRLPLPRPIWLDYGSLTAVNEILCDTQTYKVSSVTTLLYTMKTLGVDRTKELLRKPRKEKQTTLHQMSLPLRPAS